MIAYDVGMHNGDDTAYYLAKGFSVVAVEANPELAAAARDRFADAIAEGAVVIEECGVGADDAGVATFFVTPESTVQSSFNPPAGLAAQEVVVQTKTLSGLVADHGPPDLMKIDIESMDLVALRDLREHAIVPPYLSAEAHSFEILLELYNMGYRRFRLVNGRTVHEVFGDMAIRRLAGGHQRFIFRKHSAGPYGDDVKTPWMTIEGACQLWLARESIMGRGWFDVHASLAPGSPNLFLG
jgi:FkbM family methyltransferase